MRIAATIGVVLAALAAPARADESTLDKVARTRTIVVGYDETPPFSFFTAAGTPSGYVVELCGALLNGLAERAGIAPLAVTWKVVPIGERIDTIAAGAVDLFCGGLTDTHSREEHVDFSQMIFVGGGSVAVRKDSPIQAFTELQGKKVAIIPSTTGAAFFAAYLKKNELDVQLVEVADHFAGMAALASKAVDGFASDRAILTSLTLTLDDPSRVRVLAKTFSYEPIALAMRPNDSRFRLAINRELSRFFQSKELLPLVRRWLMPELGTPAEDRVLAAMYLLSTRPD